MDDLISRLHAYIFMEEAGLCPIENEKPKADEAIDKAMRGEW